MEKFECRGFGDCCRKLKLWQSDKKEILASKSDYMQLVPEAEDVSLAALDWEIDGFRENADALKTYVSISPLWALVSHKNELVVVSWNINHDSCPFLSEENRCKIYQDRPLVCKMFPMLTSGLLDMIGGRTGLSIKVSLDCRCWQQAISEVQKGLSSEGVFKLLFDIFGDSYKAALRWDAQHYFLTHLVRDLAARNKIRAVALSRQQISKMLSKGYIRLLDFVEREKIMAREELMKRITDAETLGEDLISGKTGF